MSNTSATDTDTQFHMSSDSGSKVQLEGKTPTKPDQVCFPLYRLGGESWCFRVPDLRSEGVWQIWPMEVLELELEVFTVSLAGSPAVVHCSEVER